MKTSTKICLIVAASLILAGLVTVVGVLTIMKFDFKNFSTNKYVTNTQQISESFESIEIISAEADITLLPSDDGTCRVVFYDDTKLCHSACVVDGVLSINTVNTRKWYDYVHINASWQSSTVTVYLPELEYNSLSIVSYTSYVDIPADFSFDCINVEVSTGDVKCHASASNSLSIKTSTGYIELDSLSTADLSLKVSTGQINVSSVSCSGDVSISVSTGKVFLDGLTCNSLTTTGDTGDITLKNVIATEKFSIERSTGDVTLESCDASEIFITTDTGDVKGTLLSDKVFITKTDTGRIKVPNSITGGRCEITTDTGDIILSANQ